MKIAKKRIYSVIQRNARRPRPHYRLCDLLAEMPPDRIELDDELRAWENMVPVGREFGAEAVDQMLVFMKQNTKKSPINLSIKSMIEEGRE